MKFMPVNEQKISELQDQIERLKDDLLEHDRAVVDRVGLSGQPSPEEKKARSAIIRSLNKTRRTIHKLSNPHLQRKKVTLTLTEADLDRLAEEAQAEGLGLNAWLIKKLTDWN